MKKTLLFLVGFMCLNNYAQTIPTPDYSHRFSGELQNTEFTIGNNISLVTDRFGYANNAAFLDSNHGEFSLNIPSNSTLKSQGTISFWYKHSALGGFTINESRPIVYMHNGNTSFFEGIMLANSNVSNPNKLRYASYRNSSTGIAGYSATTFNTTDWVHYAINYKFGSGGYYKIYVNGVLSDNIAMNHTISDLALHNKITFLGITSSLGWSSLTGYLDDILVYNTNLTDSQINTIYNETYSQTTPIKKLLYKFDGNTNDFYENYNLSTYGNFVYSTNNLNQSNKSGAFNIGTGMGVHGKVPSSFNSDISGSNFSISFGIKPGDIISEDSGMGTGDGIYRPIVVIPSSTELGYSLSERLYIGINFSDRKLVVRQNQQVLLSDVILENNSASWYYVNVTVDQNYIKLYVNGNLDSTLTLNSALQPISTSESISVAHMYSNNVNYFYRGLIDELFFASVTHSATTVSNMYNQYLNTGNTLSSPVVDFNSNKIKVFPNPTKGLIHFSQEVLNATVYDIQGRVILNVTNVDKLDISFQNNGVYFIQIKSDKVISTHKIIKN